MKINVAHHINRIYGEKNTIISTTAGKAFDKIQHPFMIKKKGKHSTQTRNKRELPQSNKGIYKKLTASVILNGK